MGAADAVPGVSGATVALILGIYQDFIGALHQVVRLPNRIRSKPGRQALVNALRLLVPLGIGVVCAYYLSSKLLVGPTEEPGLLRRADSAPMCYGFLFGLVLFSIRQPWKTRQADSWLHLVVALLAAIAAAWFVGLIPDAATPPTWMLLLGGAGAIAMMLLPGVSGSLFLVIVGQYQAVHRAIQDFDITVMAVFALGIGLGVVAFVPTLKRLLEKKHDLTMAALSGLMAGSLRALWPWKDNYDLKLGPLRNTEIGDSVPLICAFALAGGLFVYGLVQLEAKLRARTQPSNVHPVA